MRYSPFAGIESEKLADPGDSNERFFARVAAEVGIPALHGALLLVGAKDPRALALRRAQAVLRFDRRPSKWSHAALIVRWHERVREVAGVEVTLDPEDYRRQVPERNGVTGFSLGRYCDERLYPNVALVVLGFSDEPAPEGGGSSSVPSGAERRRVAIQTALTPLRDRERFPFWEMLGAWARHAYLPYTTTNPLLEGIPLPGAALCEYAYEAAGLDLTPGATGNNNSPEVLYATAKHWSAGLGQTQAATVRLFSLVRERHEVPQDELPAELDELSAPALDGEVS